LGDPNSKSLGVTIVDFDNDGWPDIFVSNDTQPNKLYHNNRNGTFGEQGMSAGVAYGEDGVAREPWASIGRIMTVAAARTCLSATFEPNVGSLSQ